MPRHSAAAAIENLRSRKNPSFSIGWLQRASQAVNAPSTARLASPAPTTCPDVQPCAGASMIAHSSKPRPAIDSSAPAGSGGSAAGFFEPGTSSRAPAQAAATIGILTRKMEPHQNLASSRPPAIGPIAIPSPMVAAQPAMARARSAGSRNMSLMIDSEAGIVSAAPAPMTARHAISRSTDPENAAPTDPEAKTARPRRKNRLRPSRSARLPPTSSNPAKTIA